MEPYRVELSPYRPGYSYRREIKIWQGKDEVAVFDATKVPVELVEWIMENLSAEMQRLGLEVGT